MCQNNYYFHQMALVTSWVHTWCTNSLLSGHTLDAPSQYSVTQKVTALLHLNKNLCIYRQFLSIIKSFCSDFYCNHFPWLCPVFTSIDLSLSIWCMSSFCGCYHAKEVRFHFLAKSRGIKLALCYLISKWTTHKNDLILSSTNGSVPSVDATYIQCTKLIRASFSSVL